jgi:hypothetical protein
MPHYTTICAFLKQRASLKKSQAKYTDGKGRKPMNAPNPVKGIFGVRIMLNCRIGNLTEQQSAADKGMANDEVHQEVCSDVKYRTCRPYPQHKFTNGRYN